MAATMEYVFEPLVEHVPTGEPSETLGMVSEMSFEFNWGCQSRVQWVRGKRGQ